MSDTIKAPFPWFGVDKEKGHVMLFNEVGNCETQDFHCAARTGLCSIRAHRSQRPNRTRRALKARHSMTETEKRFWAKVNKTETCWLWMASTRPKMRGHNPDFGYGAFGYTKDGVTVQTRAHRFSFELHNGKIQDGLCVLHSCDNPLCVNPAHLFLGTRADNNHDMCAKGRHISGGTHCGKTGAGYSLGKYKRGEKHHNAKLTPELVQAIRAEYANGKTSYSKLAAKFSIGICSAWKIVKRELWKHVA